MLGLLCSKTTREKYYSTFNSLLPSGVVITTFCIEDVDLEHEEIIDRTGKRMDIPQTIINLSVQHSRKQIKKLRRLSELNKSTLINPANRYNQWMIMEMLTSWNTTRGYVMPYQLVSSDEMGFTDSVNKNYLLMPQKGTSLSAMVYLKQLFSSFQIIHKSETSYTKFTNVTDNVRSLLLKKRWIKIETPDLRLLDNQISTQRIYLQKDVTGLWKVLATQNSRYLTEVALSLISIISKYLPLVGYCFIDFCFEESRPFFLHFGGWDRRLIRQDNKELLVPFCDTLGEIVFNNGPDWGLG